MRYIEWGFLFLLSGLGIGLALCKIIVQEHNGTIRVYDREPHGAVFEVIMPALE